MKPGARFAEARDNDTVMFEAEQARLLLKAAEQRVRHALAARPSEDVVRELELAEAQIGGAHGALGNAQGVQLELLDGIGFA